jgi:hypothetical protein
MSKLSLVVDDRELSTLRAALLLLQEQLDALPEDLAEMIGRHRPPVTASEIERLSLRLDRQTNLTRDYANQEFRQPEGIVEVERFSAAAAIRNSA